MKSSPTDEFMEGMISAFKEFRSSLTKETDRGCALYAAAYLDRALSDLLFLSLVENKNVEKDLFEGTAPLATFSSRIKLAYYLGKISPSMRRDLDLIRKIRNDFAHSAENLSFENEKIANRCKELHYTYHESDQRPRGHFTAAVCGILGTVQTTGLHSIAPTERKDQIPSEQEKKELRDKVTTQFEEIVRAATQEQKQAEQGGADQPATAPESKSEGDEKPQPESAGRSQ